LYKLVVLFLAFLLWRPRHYWVVSKYPNINDETKIHCAREFLVKISRGTYYKLFHDIIIILAKIKLNS
jgi:hypothetical protein